MPGSTLDPKPFLCTTPNPPSPSCPGCYCYVPARHKTQPQNSPALIHFPRRPRVLFIQGDNASDCKDRTTLAVCCWLVHIGVFDRVELGFLLVGHTHEDIDQVHISVSNPLTLACPSSTSCLVASSNSFLRAKCWAYRYSTRCFLGLPVPFMPLATFSPLRN
jgi:hypothetical protein